MRKKEKKERKEMEGVSIFWLRKGVPYLLAENDRDWSFFILWWDLNLFSISKIEFGFQNL